MTEQADGMNLDDDPMESFKIGYEYFKNAGWVCISRGADESGDMGGSLLVS